MMLRGIRIVDFTRYLPGPYCTQRLADFGAEIIKVEPPRAGDPTRLSPTSIKVESEGVIFRANNKRKKSITINQKHDAGRDIAFRLACTADVVIEGFRPGAADALGIGYEAIKVVKPDIIYCSLSGYGQITEFRNVAGHDLNYMSYSGMLAQFKDSDGKPIHPRVQIADIVGGVSASEAILAALVKKGLQGEGSYLDVSLAGTMKDCMSTYKTIYDEIGEQQGIEILNGAIVSYAMYRTQDNRYVTLAALEKKFWEHFCYAVDRTDWINQHLSPAIDDNRTYSELKVLFASRTLQEWQDFALRVDCCLAPVLELSEVDFSDRAWHQPHDPSMESCHIPSLGEHTDSILREVLGLSEQELEVLHAQNAI